jgi:tryptophan halogenase
VTYKDGLFLEPSWLAVYFGQRVMPTGYDPLADAFDATTLNGRLREMHEQVRNTASRMPSHEQFLASYCPAEKP